MQETTLQTATSSSPDEAGKSAIEVLAMRILKLADCPTLSGRSTLTYHVGCNTTGDIRFRVTGNTGGGFFNADWIALETIQRLLEKLPPGKALTSQLFYPLFRGRSMNSPAFLLAVLKAEGLVLVSNDKQRRYEPTDMAAFMAEMQGLMASAVDLPVEAGAKTGKAEGTAEDRTVSVKPSTLKPKSGKKVA